MLIPFSGRHLRSARPFADGSHAARLVAAEAARRRADRPPVEFWGFAGPLGLAWSYSSLGGTLVCRADWTAQRSIHSVRTYPPVTPADPFFSGRSSRQPDLRVSQADGAAAVLLFRNRTRRQICRRGGVYPALGELWGTAGRPAGSWHYFRYDRRSKELLT